MLISPFSISTIEFNLLMFSTLLLFFCKVMSTTLLLVLIDSFEKIFPSFSWLSCFSVFLYLLIALITASKFVSFNSSSFIISLESALKLMILFESAFLITKSLSRNIFTLSAMLLCVIKDLDVSFFINLLILCHNAYIFMPIIVMYGGLLLQWVSWIYF